MSVNTLGALNVAMAALPHILQRDGGRFVIISSMAGCLAAPGQSAYAAAKAALNGYFTTLSTELHQR